MVIMHVSPWAGDVAPIMSSVVIVLGFDVAAHVSVVRPVVLPHVDGRRRAATSGLRGFWLHHLTCANQALSECSETEVWHLLHHLWLSPCGRMNCRVKPGLIMNTQPGLWGSQRRG